MKRSQITLLMIFSALPMTSAADDVARVRTQLTSDSPLWVGQQVSFHIDLMSSTFFSGSPRFDLPEVPGTFIMKVEGRPVISTEQVDGESWSIQRHSFSVYPHRAGTFTVPAFSVRFSVAPAFGKPPEEQCLKTESLTFEAQLPAGAEGLSLLISTPELAVEEVWTPPVPADGVLELKAGDAMTRSISLRTRDVPGMALPPITMPEPDGASAYPKQPTVRDEENRGQLTGVRTDAVTFVFQRPGEVVLPAIVIPWWDTEDKVLQRVKLPSVTVTVTQTEVAIAASNDSAVAATPPDSMVTTALVASALVVSVVIVSLFLRIPGRLGGRWKAWQARRDESETAYFAQVKLACKDDDPVATLNAMLRWLDKRSIGSEVVTLDAFFKRRANPRLLVEISDLQRAAIGRSNEWSGHRLLAQLSKFRLSQERRDRAAPRSSLPPLNPKTGEI